MGRLQPTTKAQVSGHKFLRRRVEHGLVFGDTRMIHDPLRGRERSLAFSVVALCLTLLGAGLMAWVAPQPDPGDAPIVRSERGQLYVRIDDTLHPVPNLASARLIAGQPADAVTIGDSFIAASRTGPALGIDPAPDLIAPSGDAALAACQDRAGAVMVVASLEAVEPLGADEAVLVSSGSRDWLVSNEGRREIPPAETPAGRALRRELGIGAPALPVAPEVVEAARELPVWSLPIPLPEVLVDGQNRWALSDGKVARLGEVGAAVLAAAGALERPVSSADVAQYPDGQALALPSARPRMRSVEGICLSSHGAGVPRGAEAVPVVGESIASGFVAAGGAVGAAVVVDTGSGDVIVSPNGMVHVVDKEALGLLGVERSASGDWAVLKLLPQGPALSAQEARKDRRLGDTIGGHESSDQRTERTGRPD